MGEYKLRESSYNLSHKVMRTRMTRRDNVITTPEHKVEGSIIDGGQQEHTVHIATLPSILLPFLGIAVPLRFDDLFTNVKQHFSVGEPETKGHGFHIGKPDIVPKFLSFQTTFGPE